MYGTVEYCDERAAKIIICNLPQEYLSLHAA